MSNFATPQWESTDFGDEMCKKLFKGNKNKNITSKKESNIKKAKKKLKKLTKMNPNLLKNIDQMSKVPKTIRKKFSKTNATEFKHSLVDDSSKTNTKINKEFTVKKKTKKLKQLKKDIGNKIAKKNLNGNMKNKIETVNKKLKDSQLVNDLTEKYTKTKIQLNKFKKGEDTEFLLKSPKKTKSLRERMLERLKASRFRYLNEQIYTTESKKAQELFNNDPEAFQAYHDGYRQQVKRWPINPVDVIIKDIKQMSKNVEIADFGCGDAKISLEVQQKVHSFDLVATNERVVACDMSKVPLDKNSVDVVVFCLSLMGTNLHDYLKEANRVLKVGGVLKIAEVESRFDNVDNFIKGVQHFGFQNVHKDFSHNLFYFMDFKKVNNVKKCKGLPTLSLHPCLYKKR